MPVSRLEKMKTTLTSPVTYQLLTETTTLTMNEFIKQKITLHYTGEITCSSCQKPTKKSFMQGFCYPCMIKVPEASECIIKPERCRAHEGIGRDPDWEEKHHNQPHFVYLAKSASIKVGVTRDTQIPTRWIDQGAIEAIPIAKTPNRYIAGCIEVELKKSVTDRTNWQKMLKNDITTDTLEAYTTALTNKIPEPYQKYALSTTNHTQINYPVITYPQKIKSINLDKTPIYTGTLVGIKGQYLLFDDDHVINIRKFTGYKIKINPS